MALDLQLAQLAMDNADGADWYECAGREISSVCEAAGWDVRIFTGVLSVTSPRVSVARNVRITLHYMDCGELFDNVMRGIRTGVTKFVDHGRIDGLKTGAFYNALMGDEDSVVLDVHMANLLCVDQKVFAGKRKYNEYADFIRGVAVVANMSPRACQAALWAAQLRIVGRVPTRMNVVTERNNQIAHGGFPCRGSIAQLVCADGSVQNQLF
jgi:hypothetical protein